MAVNDDIRDAILRHRSYLQRMENGAIRRLKEPIREAIAALVAAIMALEGRFSVETPLTSVEIEFIRRRVSELLTILETAEATTISLVALEFLRVAQAEETILLNIIDRHIPSALNIQLNPLTPEAVTTAVATPLGGVHWEDAVRKTYGTLSDQVQASLTQSFMNGESMNKAARDVKKILTDKAPFQITRLVRTHIQGLSNQIALDLYKRNTDVIKAVQWLATLDERTCFPEEVIVDAEHGMVSIASIRIGDRVWSLNDKLATVTGVLVREVHGEEMVIVAFESGRTLTVTREHPVFVDGIGFTEASMLFNGDVIQTQTGLDIIREVLLEEYSPEEVITVYNLEVGETNAFYANGFLVHNCMICGSLDGEIFPLTGPEAVAFDPPPIHPLGRCSLSPLTLSWRELGYDIDELPEGTRISMNGEVPESLNFQDWLKLQEKSSPGFARDILGPNRYKLWKEGKIEFSKLVSDDKILTLSQLQTQLGISIGEAQTLEELYWLAPITERLDYSHFRLFGDPQKVVWNTASALSRVGFLTSKSINIAKPAVQAFLKANGIMSVSEDPNHLRAAVLHLFDELTQEFKSIALLDLMEKVRDNVNA